MAKNRFFENIQELRNYLLQELNNKRSLRSIQREEFPSAKAGTLSRIVNDQNYEPRHIELRSSLRLEQICPCCLRPLKEKKEDIVLIGIRGRAMNIQGDDHIGMRYGPKGKWLLKVPIFLVSEKQNPPATE